MNIYVSTERFERGLEQASENVRLFGWFLLYFKYDCVAFYEPDWIIA